MLIALLIAIILLIMFTTSYSCYITVFTVDKSRLLDPYVLLKGSQYAERKEKIHSLINSTISIPFEDVYITSFDGLRLHGAYYETQKGAPVEIMFHGYRSIAIRDFSGGLQLAIKAGHNVLLVDQRAHGKSDGRCLTFGIFEQLDCLSWIDYAIKQNGAETKIILVGVSMGASTVLMSSGLKLPENVVGIIADSGYTSPKAIICKVLRDRHLPTFIVYPLIYFGAFLFGKFDLQKCDSRAMLKKSKIPILFIHGEADHFVPCKMSIENYTACASEKKIITIPNAGHGLGYIVDSIKYTDALDEFFKKVL